MINHKVETNHDKSHQYTGYANIGATIDKLRDDMNYLGSDFAKVWLTPKVDMNLIHPGDGSAYSYSLKAQQRIDKAFGMQKSKILVLGHYHKFDFLYYKDTYGITMPSFQGMTSFFQARNIMSEIGGVFLTVNVNKLGELVSLGVESVPYKEKVNNY